jgi:hypothetical protein
MAPKFDPIHEFLLENHKEEHITVFSSRTANWDWAKDIKKSEIATKDGLIIFVGKRNKVLYIGQSEFINKYVTLINNIHDMEPAKVYVVNNENPSSRIMNVNSYRARFNPVHNSNRNHRFMFDSGKIVLNLSPRYEKIVQWIVTHPESTYTSFTKVYNVADIAGLCKAFSLIRVSYKDLKAAIKANNKDIIVLNRGL